MNRKQAARYIWLVNALSAHGLIIRESHTSERACPTCGAGLRCHVTNWSDYTCDACGGQFIASRPGFETLNPAIKSRPFPSEC